MNTIKYTVSVIMTCFNRKELTERCIRSLIDSAKLQDLYELTFYIVNDGCTDGTKEMLDNKFPFVNQLYGNGELYWNGGMHLAFSKAVECKSDFYLWVNDDVLFYEGMLLKLLEQWKTLRKVKCIISGYTVAPDGVTVTYGGQLIKKGLIPLNLVNTLPDSKNKKCDSMHGNCVLIPSEVVEQIGIIDPYYTHGFGDVDYGLRASRSGINIFLSNIPVGICEKNPCSNRKNVYANKKMKERFEIMNSWRHRPYKDWLYFTKKFGGRLWFLRFIAPYCKLVINRYE